MNFKEKVIESANHLVVRSDKSFYAIDLGDLIFITSRHSIWTTLTRAYIYVFFKQEVSTIRVCETHEYLDLSTEPAICKNCTVCEDASAGEEPMAFRSVQPM